MNYSTLIGDATTAGSVKYHANWARLDSAGILDEAEKWIYAKLRVADMVTAANVTIALDAISAALPERYLDPIILAIPGYMVRLRYTDLERFKANLSYDESGILPVAMPTRWAREGSSILFNHKSDAAYTGRLTFFQRPAPLSASNETNWLTDRYPTLVRRACLAYAYEERKEMDMADRAFLKATEAIEEIKVENDLNMRSMSFDHNWADGDE